MMRFVVTDPALQENAAYPRLVKTIDNPPHHEFAFSTGASEAVYNNVFDNPVRRSRRMRTRHKGESDHSSALLRHDHSPPITYRGKLITRLAESLSDFPLQHV